MKKSELKEAIKTEIKSVLTEGTGIFGTSIRDLDQYPEEIEVGDIVTLTTGGDELEVIDSREMFGSDMMAYRVKFPDGNTEEYSSDQLRLAEGNLKEVYQTNSKMSQIVSLFQDMMDDEYDGQDYRKVLNMVLKAIDDDYKAAEREGEKFSRIREDEEPTAADLKKKDSVATISNKLQKLTAKMKKKAKEFKEAEGKAKEKIKDELKDMTAEKKKLEKDL
jgi:hypothetical protein